MENNNGISNFFIDSILKSVKNNSYYYGVYSANNIPTHLITKKNFSIISNLSNVGENGSHFITIIAYCNYVLYLDSFGLPCINENIATFLNSLKRPIFYNATQIQDFSSLFCGYYCVLFVLFFNCHKKNKHLQMHFNNANLLENDNKCVMYICKFIKVLRNKKH